MSATYNWAYRPSVTNKYGFTVPSGADSTRPTGWCYVALFGNDTTGNGSRQYPYRTISKAITTTGASTTYVIGSGVYREAATLGSYNAISIIGDGDVIIDISYIGRLLTQNIEFGYYNLQILGNGASTLTSNPASNISSIGGKVVDCTFTGSFFCTTSNAIYSNCIVNQFSGQVDLANNFSTNGQFRNCTFYQCNNIRLNGNQTITPLQITDACIFHTCNICSATTNFASVQYSLIYNCNIKLTQGVDSGGTLYPSTPSGYTYYNSIVTLKSAYFTAYSLTAFTGCTIADPLFNNLSIGDFSVSFSSPAKNLSFSGTYAGAKSIAYPIKAAATEAVGSFDFSTNINLNVANDSITLIDPMQNAEIKTKMIINAAGRQIQKLPIYGFNADRNGQYIDSIPDLDTTVKNAGDTLTVPASYLVETGAITYNGALYQPGDRLTTVAGQAAFTSAVGGVLREILEAPERHTIMARFSDGGANVSAGDALVAGYWYYVVSGSITYDSVVYNAGTGFKAVDTNAFSGSGTVIIALSTEAFQHYEPGIQPTSNNTGDTRTGSIIRGNGDPAYIRGGYGVQEFPINAKFIQLYYIINVSNLKP